MEKELEEFELDLRPDERITKEELEEMENDPYNNMSDKINFIPFIISEFAKAYKMDVRDAYLYLREYKGLDYIFEFWWTLHVDNPFWSVRDIHDYCHRNGGLR